MDAMGYQAHLELTFYAHVARRKVLAQLLQSLLKYVSVWPWSSCRLSLTLKFASQKCYISKAVSGCPIVAQHIGYLLVECHPLAGR
jgi:hypothetical protein